MKRLAYLFATILACGIISSCATILHGSTEDVTFTTQPPGAKVYDSGNMLGVTPITTKVRSNRPLAVTFKLDGYEDVTRYFSSGLMGGYLIFDILCGLMPVIVDAATGDWYSLDLPAYNRNSLGGTVGFIHTELEKKK